MDRKQAAKKKSDPFCVFYAHQDSAKVMEVRDSRGGMWTGVLVQLHWVMSEPKLSVAVDWVCVAPPLTSADRTFAGTSGLGVAGICAMADDSIDTVYLLIGWAVLVSPHTLTRLAVRVFIVQCLRGRKGLVLTTAWRLCACLSSAGLEIWSLTQCTAAGPDS